MLTKTHGIVIKTIKQGESSAITKIFTEEFGLLGYHVPAVFKNKGAIKPSHLQALNCVEFSFNFSTTKNLYTIKDLTCHSHFHGTQFAQQAYYNVISELMGQILKEHEQNQTLFQYLYHYLVPSMEVPNSFWQLPTAMLQILYHYGCAPNTEIYKDHALLDLENGIFREGIRQTRYTASPQVSHIIYTILARGSDQLEQDHTLRHQCIETLILYYKLHINEHFDLRSREVLWQVMKG